MVGSRKELKNGGLLLLAFFLAFICAAQAAYPPSADISVNKVAQVNGITVTEVNPGQTFNYNITVTNTDLANSAPEVVVTDKLPWDVTYLGASVYPATLDYTLNKSGDIVNVRFNEIAAGATRYINFTVTAPTESPVTLYDIVNMRYGNDPNLLNNRVTVSTIVPSVGYDQTVAAKSFEDLLHNQSQLLFDFEDLLHSIPSSTAENYTFLASFEQLLRSQATLTSGFEDLLTNPEFTGWDTPYDSVNRTYLLKSYEQMLWDEAFLFSSFNMKFNDSWMSLCDYTAPGHTQDAQTEFIASFEDLLKRQNRLFKSFDLLLNKIQPGVSHADMIDFLSAYENLLRVESNLYMDFNQKLTWEYEGQNPCGYVPPPPPGCTPPTITATWARGASEGQVYTITVTNPSPSVALSISSLTGTFSGTVVQAGTVWERRSTAATTWTNVANVYSNTISSPISLAPGASRVFTLDYLYASPLTLPGTLTANFCVTTDCGPAVCYTRTDSIGFLTPPPA